MANGMYVNCKNLMLGAGTHTLIDWNTDTIKVILVDTADYSVNLSTHQDLDDVAVRCAGRDRHPRHASPSPPVSSTPPTKSSRSVTGDQSEALVLYKDTGVSSTSHARRLLRHVRVRHARHPQRRQHHHLLERERDLHAMKTWKRTRLIRQVVDPRQRRARDPRQERAKRSRSIWTGSRAATTTSTTTTAHSTLVGDAHLRRGRPRWRLQRGRHPPLHHRPRRPDRRPVGRPVLDRGDRTVCGDGRAGLPVPRHPRRTHHGQRDREPDRQRYLRPRRHHQRVERQGWPYRPGTELPVDVVRRPSPRPPTDRTRPAHQNDARRVRGGRHAEWRADDCSHEERRRLLHRRSATAASSVTATPRCTAAWAARR